MSEDFRPVSLLNGAVSVVTETLTEDFAAMNVIDVAVSVDVMIEYSSYGLYLRNTSTRLMAFFARPSLQRSFFVLQASECSGADLLQLVMSSLDSPGWPPNARS